MKKHHHFNLASISIITWAVLYLAGLPSNYFQDYSGFQMLMLLLITFFAILPILTVVVLTFIRLPFFRTSVWFAFYASIPLFILDTIFVGIIKGEGFHFLISHWYLTVGYFAVWIEMPLIGKTLEQLSIKIINQEV